MKKQVLFLLLVLLTNTLVAQLKINELMTNNVSAVIDDSYNYSMWVELYNTSTTTLIISIAITSPTISLNLKNGILRYRK